MHEGLGPVVHPVRGRARSSGRVRPAPADVARRVPMRLLTMCNRQLIAVNCQVAMAVFALAGAANSVCAQATVESPNEAPSVAGEHTAPVARGPHRLRLALGGGVATTFVDDDGHWKDSGVTWSLSAGYAYRALPHLELQAGLSLSGFFYPDPTELRQTIVLPRFGVRPYLGAKSVEVGLGVGIGAYVLVLSNAPPASGPPEAGRPLGYLGFHVYFAPDVRVWVSRRVALEIGVEGVFGRANDQSSMGGWYLRRDSMLVSGGGSVGVVCAFP